MLVMILPLQNDLLMDFCLLTFSSQGIMFLFNWFLSKNINAFANDLSCSLNLTIARQRFRSFLTKFEIGKKSSSFIPAYNGNTDMMRLAKYRRFSWCNYYICNFVKWHWFYSFQFCKLRSILYVQGAAWKSLQIH